MTQYAELTTVLETDAETLLDGLSLEAFLDNQVERFQRDAANPTQVWCSMHIDWYSNQPALLGRNTRRRARGELVFMFAALPDTGTTASQAAIDSVASHYEGLVLSVPNGSSVSFQAAEQRGSGERDGFWRSNVHCPFYSDQVS